MAYNSHKLLSSIGCNVTAFPVLPSALVRGAQSFAVATLKKQKTLESGSVFYESVGEEFYRHLLNEVKGPQLKTLLKTLDKHKVGLAQETDLDLRQHVFDIVSRRADPAAPLEKKLKVSKKAGAKTPPRASSALPKDRSSPLDSSAMSAKWDGKDHD